MSNGYNSKDTRSMVSFQDGMEWVAENEASYDEETSVVYDW